MNKAHPVFVAKFIGFPLYLPLVCFLGFPFFTSIDKDPLNLLAEILCKRS